MTNVTVLPVITASHSHLLYPSPVLLPGTVLTLHLHARFQFCSVRRTGRPAGSASCSPGLHSWRSSGGHLGPEDAQTDRQSQGSRTLLGTKSKNTTLVSAELFGTMECDPGPVSNPLCPPPPPLVEGTEAPCAARLTREGSSQHTGKGECDGHQTPPFPEHLLGGNLDCCKEPVTSQEPVPAGKWTLFFHSQ